MWWIPSCSLKKKWCLGPKYFLLTSKALIALPVEISTQGQKHRRRRNQPFQQPFKTSAHPWRSCSNAGNYLRNEMQLDSAPESPLQSKQGEGGSLGLIWWSGDGGEQVMLEGGVELKGCQLDNQSIRPCGSLLKCWGRVSSVQNKVCYRSRCWIWMCELGMVSLGNTNKSLVIVMTVENQSEDGSVYFVYSICFFQGTLQMGG